MCPKNDVLHESPDPSLKWALLRETLVTLRRCGLLPNYFGPLLYAATVLERKKVKFSLSLRLLGNDY